MVPYLDHTPSSTLVGQSFRLPTFFGERGNRRRGNAGQLLYHRRSAELSTFLLLFKKSLSP
jgi:hypothetical protein